MRGRLGLVLAALAGGWTAAADAGGLHLDLAGAQVNGKSQATLSPGEPYVFCASGDVYLYDGPRDERAYLVILVKRAELPHGRVDRSWFVDRAMLNVVPLTHGSGAQPICSDFRAPATPGNYYFEYGYMPLFAKGPVGFDVGEETVFIDDIRKYRDVENYLNQYARALGELHNVAVKVAPNSASTEVPPSTVLWVNGVYPGGPKVPIAPGYSETPVNFVWKASNPEGYEPTLGQPFSQRRPGSAAAVRTCPGRASTPRSSARLGIGPPGPLCPSQSGEAARSATAAGRSPGR